ncbi:ATPase [Mesorhizobium sp. SARCC-RB16n]|uniref:ATPase n=1 Tax=Mesorhizobium sp. SARCC-RB16n TaxID=2116687 RepID=UPI00122EBE30|nr:ATPase [Mesorhizobium sp. SARCC-RB16n]KAA3441935.1 ATPase [Mesorhizobium sp. SARCC-RB16n]
MIAFQRTSDGPEIAGIRRQIASSVDLDIPTGRYALLTGDPLAKKPAIDLLAGLRPPQMGRVSFIGLTSWPIGRPAFLRGNVTGRHVIALICRLYGLDMHVSNAAIEMIVTDPRHIDGKVDHWPAQFRYEFGLAAALLPPFDMYIVEGVFPFLKDRFSYLWNTLFERQSSGKMLIAGSNRVADLNRYCDRAIIVNRGRVAIANDLKKALDRYPPRAASYDVQKEFDNELTDDLL